MTRKLFLQGPGLKKVVVIEVEDAAHVADVISRAREVGADVDVDAIAMLEDTDDPLDHGASLDAAGLREKAGVHVGRCRKVSVVVRYGRDTKEEDFSPAQRLRLAFKWAVGKRGFDISDGDAQDLVLVIQGQQQSLDLDDQIGLHIAGRECKVRLELIPSDRIQG
ncbi:MAG: hypothetical protein ABL963_00385 [Longimicrobiales bacterium]